MSRLTERAGLVALGLFLVVDVLLVGIAINSTRQPVEGSGATLDVASSAKSGTTGSTATATDSPTTSGVDVVPLQVGLQAVDHSTALRWSTGTCKDGGADLALTRNGGKTWGPRSAPFRTIMRIRVRADHSAFVVGADPAKDCSPSIRQAPSYDADFGDSQSVDDVWYRDPRSTTVVGLPGGGSGKPCGKKDVVDLSVVDSGAAALCQDGQVMVTTTGTSWESSASVKGALALSLDPQGRTLLAVPAVGSCTGIAIVDAAKPKTAQGCAEVSLDSVEAGHVALSVLGDGGWLVVGDATYVAGSGLDDWKKA